MQPKNTTLEEWEKEIQEIFDENYSEGSGLSVNQQNRILTIIEKQEAKVRESEYLKLQELLYAEYQKELKENTTDGASAYAHSIAIAQHVLLSHTQEE